MKTAQMIAAALIFTASVSAMAQQTTDSSTNTHANVAATQDSKEINRGKTRAEVIAELQQAEANGKGMPSGFVAFDAPAKSGTSSENTAIART
jgi:hypothetical protein